MVLWLPLNGNLDNQGLADATVTNHGATVNTSGKIGSCYNFDGSDDYISIDCTDLYKVFSGGSQQFTITFWIYHNDSTRGIIFGDYGLSGTMQFNIELTTGHRIRFYWAGSPDKNFASASAVSLSNWTHIALTYDGNQVLIYKDGILQTDKYTGTLATKNKTSGVFYLGRDSRTGNTALNGGLNDFRIYDRCLSYRECKSISSGLVLHYPLSGIGGANYLKNSNFTTGTNGLTGYTLNTSRAEKQIDGVLKITSTSNTGGIYSSNFNAITTGDMTTFSAYVKADSNMTIYIGVDGSGISNCLSYEIGTNWKRISISKTKTTSNPNVRIYGNGTFYIKLLKYELGDKATPWLPNSSDPEYAAFGLNDGIEYDVSGYKRNGTKVGDITYSSDTPRYNTGCFFNNNGYIDTSYKPQNQEEITIAFWFKFNVSQRNCMVSCYSGDNTGSFIEIESMNSKQLRIHFSDENKVLKSWVLNNTPLILGEWYFCAVTYTKNTHQIIVYINDDNSNNLNNYSDIWQDFNNIHSSRYNIRIGSMTNNDSIKYNGYISDLRIYTTALSAEDIEALYHTPISLSSSGTLLTHGEYVES